MSKKPKPWPSQADTTVPRVRSPLSFHTAARAIRPPSSGKAGMRLKTRMRKFIDAVKPMTSSTGEVVDRSEEHTSELQSRQYLVCRLLLEKKIIKRRGRRFGLYAGARRVQ